MSDFSDWLQNNWIDLARLAVQGAILAVVVSYGRKLLRTLRASQEQVGALLKLSVSDATAQPPAAAAAPAEYEPSLEAKTFSSLLPEPKQASKPVAQRTNYTEREQSLGGRVVHESAGASAIAVEDTPSFTPWIAAPGMEPQVVETRAANQVLPSANRVSSWLQAPMGKPSASPWRKMVRWLQAPAGH